MRKYIIILILLSVSCKTKQVVVSYTNLRDSTRIEVIAPQRVANKLIEEVSDIKQALISSERRSSVVASKTALKQAVSDNKKEVKIAKSDNAVAKVEARKDAAVEKKQIQSEIVASRQIPKTVKWIAVLVIALIVGWLVIKKKIP